MENTNEEVVDQEVEVQEEVEEEQQEEKTFDNLTDDDIANMSDEELIKLDPSNKDAEETEEPEQSEESEEKPDTAPDEEKVKSAVESDDEFVNSEEYKKFNKNERGLYHRMKDERKARQETERKLHELELERERLKAQNEVQQKFFERKQEPEQITSEHERVKREIAERAKAYEQEYGEKYRISMDEYDALEQAKQADLNRSLADWQAQEVQRNQHAEVQRVQEITTKAEQALMANDEFKDYPYVFKTFVEPIINPNVNPNRQQAVELAGMLLQAVKHGQDPAKYAYEHIATLSEEGRKYFRDKMLKQQSKSLIEKDKKIPKTSAHYTGAKPSSGRVKVTAQMMEKDESWYNKLTDDQIMRVGAGEDVYV